MSDIDCHVRLPCHEDLFRENIAEADVPTLEAVMESPTVPHHQNLDHFAMTIVMASTLGSFLRSSFKRSPNNTRVPWDPRSKFYMAHSILLHFESHSPCTFATLSDILHQQFALNNAVDQQQAGHFVFSHALFHLNHCLLNHPFILHHVFQRCPTPVPPSFVREALQRCYLHATELLDLLRDAQHFGHLVDSSFYGYCAMAAGIIHRLFEKYQDPTMTETSGEKVQVALSFLDRTPIRWKNHAHMVSHH